MSALDWIGVALLGGIGALARVTLDVLSGSWLTRMMRGPGARLAFGTFAVNISGSFALGLADGLTLGANASILLGTAGLGAYTTFSTWMLQTRTLRAERLPRAAAVNVIASLVAGFAAVALGRLIGTSL